MSGLELYEPGSTKADKRPVSTANPVPVDQVFGASGVEPVTGALSSSSDTSSFTPNPGRTFYLTISGTGTAAVTPVYSVDGVNYYPEAVALDGQAPVIVNAVAFDGGVQAGVRIPLRVGQVGVSVKVRTGTVAGTVNFSLAQ